MKCTVVICKKRATWEGEIKSLLTKHAQPVYYCDGHASLQWEKIAHETNLTIHLTPIQQRSKR